MTYDVECVVVGGGVSHAGAPFERPLRRELERMRSASDLAGELLPADIVEVLPPHAEAGAWGAVAVARTAVEGQDAATVPTAEPQTAVAPGATARGTEVVRHA